MLLLELSNNPMNKAYQVYMVICKEAHSVLLELYISYFLPLLLSLSGFLCMETIAREYHRYKFIEMRIYIMRRNAMKQ